MITMQFSPEVGKALYHLIRTAENKGRKSDWWRDLVAPLVKQGPEGGSFHTQLGRAVGP